ncbi:MAG: acylphosphatase [Pseudobutyrivibrio sp.]|nr:acylphosphatase [Pseudobutyrivibrio sp.]
MGELVRYKYIFNGRVQGVGFRYKAAYTAQKYNLTGYVRNEYDGSVVAEIQGTDAAIDMFFQTMNNDRFINIQDIDFQKLPVQEDEKSFEVLY